MSEYHFVSIKPAERPARLGRAVGEIAYTRAPAEGTWEDSDGRTRRDDIVMIEVMTERLERE